MIAGQAGNARLSSLIFIESFDGGMDEAEMRHHRFARGVGIAFKNGVEHGLVLLRELRKYRRDEIHPLAALLD